MDSLLGFKDPLSNDAMEDRSHGFKLVPWMSWDEWKFVRQSLFSSVPDSVAVALQRIAAWRSRGCVLVVIEVTASIIEIQQRDPFFRNNLNESFSQSDEILAMLYCMAIVRLVNGVVEKTRRKNEVSIGEAADAIGIPRMLIDIRHEGSHRDLPSLQLVRLASVKALEWLVSYYWEPQERAISVQKDQATNLRNEINRRLREVAFCLKAKQMAKSSSSHVKGKRVGQTETLYGRNRFLFLAARKLSHTNTAGPKKQLAKSLRNILRLYASSSAEVVYILLEYLVNALDLSNLVEQSGDYSIETKHGPFNHWESVVLKLSSKEPEFLLVLAQALLEKLETDEAMDCQTDGPQSSENAVKSCRVELLSCLFERITGHLKTSETKGPKTANHLSKAAILSLIRRCLLLSSSGNKHLLSSAVTLALMTRDSTLLHKLKKLALLDLSNSESESVKSCKISLLSGQEYSLHEAEKKFELLKLHQMQAKQEKPKQLETGHGRRWTVVKSWNPCPIGMLPHTIGFSGRLPVLDCNHEHREAATVSLSKEDSQCGKREAESGIEEMDHTPAKKMKESEVDYAATERCGIDAEGIKGHMLIDGVWRKVGAEELLALSAAVRLLV